MLITRSLLAAVLINPAVLLAVEELAVHDALRQGKVVVRTFGGGIETVKMELKRSPKAEPLIVTVPIGTTFMSRDQVQNMVSVTTVSADLQRQGLATLTVPVVCTDINLPVPGDRNEFEISSPASAKQGGEKLQRLLAVIQDSVYGQGAAYAARQAAVWIMTDDADYQGLGRLRYYGRRIINQWETAAAMRLIDEGGFDLSSKRVWDDRGRVCDQVSQLPGTTGRWCAKVLEREGYQMIDLPPEDR